MSAYRSASHRPISSAANCPRRGHRHRHRLWPNDALPGQLPQTLPRPQDFAAATSLIDRDTVAATFSCGPDVDAHVAQLGSYADAGYDEVYVQQIGPDHDGFFAAYRDEVLPALRSRG